MCTDFRCGTVTSRQSDFYGSERLFAVPCPLHLLIGGDEHPAEAFDRPRGVPSNGDGAVDVDREASRVVASERRLRSILLQVLRPFHLAITIEVIEVRPPPPRDFPPAGQPHGDRG
jgi:hypothetical protein